RVGAYVEACPRGLVIATIHLGDYLEGLRQVRLATAWRKRVFVLRRAASSDRETRAFDRVAADLDITVLRSGRGAATRAVRALQRANVVVALFDLPARFGPTVEAELLGRPLWVVRGPVELATLAGADVLPIFTHYDARGVSIVEAAPAIALPSLGSARGDGSWRDDRMRVDAAGRAVRERHVRAVTQRLWRLAEQFIRAHSA